MPDVDVKWAAVIVAAIVNMAVGAIWYSRPLFAKEWSRLTGRKMEEMGDGTKGYIVAAVASLLQAYILAHFVVYTNATTFGKGLETGFWLWLGFVAVAIAVTYVFEGRSWHLWKINAGYFLVTLLINGGLLAAWN